MCGKTVAFSSSRRGGGLKDGDTSVSLNWLEETQGATMLTLKRLCGQSASKRRRVGKRKS